jgi:hypothetical protein
MIELPDGVLEPTGQRVTSVSVRGIGPILVDEIYEDFCKRFKEFMEEEHQRGDQFHYTAFYSWQVEVNKFNQLHVKRIPSCLTLDGCRDVSEITVSYLTVDPVDLGPRSSALITGSPFAVHGPGKRRR